MSLRDASSCCSLSYRERSPAWSTTPKGIGLMYAAHFAAALAIKSKASQARSWALVCTAIAW
jgi:hypothetical protein